MLGDNTFHRIHFIGIGGIGMSGIAEILQDQGYEVSGSDAVASSATKRLEAKGVRLFYGQRAENITADLDLVVRSTAIKPDNPELAAAIAMGLPVVHRAEMLDFLMRDKRAVCVAGAHGKTTTSSMIALMLEMSGAEPTIVVGGEISQIGSNAKYGASDLLVAEADESDGSFLKLHPWMTVITNIEADHLDHYKDLEEIQGVFSKFVQKPGKDGVGVFCIDCPEVKNIMPLAPGEVITYGFAPEARIRGENWRQQGRGSVLDVYDGETLLGQLALQVPGRHNSANALATVAVGQRLGLSFEQIVQGLAAFTGAKRRFQIIGDAQGVLVIDDYAHHPTEIQATIQAAKNCQPNRLIAVFQPHRYSRTQFLARDFAKSFAGADQVIITDIYSAGESPISGVSSQLILDNMPPGDSARLIRREALNDYLLQMAAPGDMVLMLGAGNIWQNAVQLAEALKK